MEGASEQEKIRQNVERREKVSILVLMEGASEQKILKAMVEGDMFQSLF